MKKTLRNLVIGAVMAATVVTASSAVFAGQYVQTDMNFRAGASRTAASIGSVPAGAEVEVLGRVNDWDLVRYNGKTGYIHGGNLGDTYVAKKQTALAAQNTQNTYSTTQSYFDNNWTQTATNMNNNARGTWKTVYVSSGYLALREAPFYDVRTEIGQLYTGDTVQIEGEATGSYIYVYSPKYGTSGWVNAGFLG